MQLHVADTDRPNSARSAVTGQPNYSSWSPDSQSLLVHIGGTGDEAFVGTYQVDAATTAEDRNAACGFSGASLVAPG